MSDHPIIKHRAISKTISWRITASIITIVIVYLVTGNELLAISVIGIEFFTKMILYYVHEKLWNFLNQPRKGTRIRSFIKTVTWRIIASMDTVVILLILTRKPSYAALGAFLEIISKSIAYYIHERIWNNFRIEKIEYET